MDLYLDSFLLYPAEFVHVYNIFFFYYSFFYIFILMQYFDTSHLTKEIFLFYNHLSFNPYIKVVDFLLLLQYILGVPC